MNCLDINLPQLALALVAVLAPGYELGATIGGKPLGQVLVEQHGRAVICPVIVASGLHAVNASGQFARPDAHDKEVEQAEQVFANKRKQSALWALTWNALSLFADHDRNKALDGTDKKAVLLTPPLRHAGVWGLFCHAVLRDSSGVGPCCQAARDGSQGVPVSPRYSRSGSQDSGQLGVPLGQSADAGVHTSRTAQPPAGERTSVSGSVQSFSAVCQKPTRNAREKFLLTVKANKDRMPATNGGRMNVFELSTEDVLAATLLAENENASLPEYRAIATVIWNRATGGDVNRTPTMAELRDVCLAPRQFSCWNDGERMTRLIHRLHCREQLAGLGVIRVSSVVSDMMAGAFYPRSDANHYYAENMQQRPSWSDRMIDRGVVGKHRFLWDRDWRRA